MTPTTDPSNIAMMKKAVVYIENRIEKPTRKRRAKNVEQRDKMAESLLSVTTDDGGHRE